MQSIFHGYIRNNGKTRENGEQITDGKRLKCFTVLIPVLNEKDNSNRIFSTIIANRARKPS